MGRAARRWRGCEVRAVEGVRRAAPRRFSSAWVGRPARRRPGRRSRRRSRPWPRPRRREAGQGRLTTPANPSGARRRHTRSAGLAAAARRGDQREPRAQVERRAPRRLRRARGRRLHERLGAPSAHDQPAPSAEPSTRPSSSSASPTPVDERRLGEGQLLAVAVGRDAPVVGREVVEVLVAVEGQPRGACR